MRVGKLRVVAPGLAIAVVVCVLSFTGGGARQATGSPPAPDPAAPTEVPVTQVVEQTVPVYLEYVGTTDAIRTVTLQAQVTGYLAKQGVSDGSDVSKGTLLYEIDPRSYQAALDQARAQAAKDAAALEYAIASHRRNTLMSETGDVSIDTLQQSASTEHQDLAALAADHALIETALLNLDFTKIRAPFSGRLSLSQVHEGALISSTGTQLNTLVQLDPIYATFNPPDTDLATIQQDQAKGTIAAEVIVGQGASPQYRGRLTFLDNNVGRSSGTITARATVENPDHTLLPGQFIRVRLHVADAPNTLLVPQVAVGSNQLGKYVYVVGADKRVEQRYVILGSDYGPLVVVRKGVVRDDSVVVGNLLKLSPGMAVKPVAAKPS
ncbi:multidrug efflux system membrane fusion protein [Paraburkholderia sp. MM5496-R1]|uniref:efflux RND transporter periplasmic adaptor subunit n=1 Tax=Paraburkholderia sp. MM5496-R1 TaxID=2991065 RepID=UPI003D1E923A